MTRDYSDKATRSKNLHSMNPAERALLDMEVKRATHDDRDRQDALAALGISRRIRLRYPTTSSAGRSVSGPKAALKLIFHLDHSMGGGQQPGARIR